jgi:uncharacterized protein YndB with AHSA1/START domain
MNSTERAIRKETVVPAPTAEVWQAWTTTAGVNTFFAAKARIDLAIGGAYELYFDREAPPGSQGSEGCRVLSYLPGEMLSFSWNAPPQFPNVRRKRTWVVVQLAPLAPDQTRVSLTHLGWRQGDEWDQVYDYFNRAWGVVLQRLVQRFTTGALDWDD